MRCREKGEGRWKMGEGRRKKEDGRAVHGSELIDKTRKTIGRRLRSEEVKMRSDKNRQWAIG